MPRRTRTARGLVQRIDLAYFKRPHPFRRWLLILSIAAPVAGILWLAGTAAAGSRRPYSSGPLSASHAAFASRCERCHVVRASRISSPVEDAACLACHDAPAHKVNQTLTPPCSSCHVDHQGRVRLSAVADRSCTQCHASLQTTDGRHTVATSVGRFSTAHPEFAAVRPGSRDRTVLRFNHDVHMKRDLAGPNGPTTLDCVTCHRPNEPAGRVAVAPPTATAGLMARVTYARDCASCHPLYFDPLIGAQAPHDKTDVVHRAVVDGLRSYIAAHPEQVGRPDAVRRIPLNFPTPPPVPARTPDEWVRMRTAAAEQLLWKKTCAECHDLTAPGRTASLPQTVPTNMPAVWMPHARFDHRAHQLTTCESCHAGARTSRETADVLLPSIATCQRCHTPEDAAESRCFECHQYHDWARARPIRNGAFDLRALTN